MKNILSIKDKISLILIAEVFIILFGTISRYVEYTRVWYMALISLFVMLIVFSTNFRNTLYSNISINVGIIIYILYFFLDVIFTGSKVALSMNLDTVIYPLLTVLLINVLANHPKKVLEKFLYAAFPALNLYWLLNLFVLSRQITGSGFMIKAKWLAVNGFYTDQCAGLFGNSGTHELGFYSIFILIYNLIYADCYIFSKKKKKLIWGYLFATEALMAYFSTKNENMSFFVLMPFFFVLYLVMKLLWTKKLHFKQIIKVVKYLILLIIIIVIIYNIPAINVFIKDELIDRVNKVIHIRNVQEANGSNERLAIPMYALHQKWAWTWGRGLGSWRFHMPGLLGFSHFGISSIGSFITLGGIWYYLLHSFLFTMFAYKNCYTNSSSDRSPLFFCIILIIVFVLSFYTALFTSYMSDIWITMIFYMFGLLRKNNDNKIKKMVMRQVNWRI